jgi:hypothetical protein
MVQVRRGWGRRLGGRLAVLRAVWRLVCVVDMDSLMGVEKRMYWVVFPDKEDCKDVEWAHLLGEVDWVFKLRSDVWEAMSLLTAACDRRDIESSQFRSIRTVLLGGERDGRVIEIFVPVGEWRSSRFGGWMGGNVGLG